VRHALDLVRADGTRKAVPVCPFVKAWIDKHPEYKDVTQDPPTD
jgi:predicted GNAT family acetyltransferase